MPLKGDHCHSFITFSKRVILDSRYGICAKVARFFVSPRALITLPSASSPPLMWTDSDNRHANSNKQWRTEYSHKFKLRLPTWPLTFCELKIGKPVTPALKDFHTNSGCLCFLGLELNRWTDEQARCVVRPIRMVAHNNYSIHSQT